MRWLLAIIGAVSFFTACMITCAAPVADRPPAVAPEIAPASEEGAQAIARFQVPAGFAVSLFAAEPRVANPVALHVDNRGRCYVVETFRLAAGVTDVRQHPDWLTDDLACRTVADRDALLKKYLGAKYAEYAQHDDRVRLLEDRSGQGTADHDSVFAAGFNTPVSGLAAGVLEHRGAVYFACVPDLWKLQDPKQSGQATVRTKLHTGYGVHVNFLGHDLHGLTVGPDGKLYFTMGDRGLHIITATGDTISCPDTGAVLRCNLDGSELQLFATGLRNPQKLAFDDRGNLFTCDNNSDGGDQARWLHIVEGADYGWRIGYQHLTTPTLRGPWNDEKLWMAGRAEPAAYMLTALANITDGPSGLTYVSGSGWPDAYRNHFFLCDYRGMANIGGVHSLAVKPHGATFEVTDRKEFLWGLAATDCALGPDGALYVSDWVGGWSKTGKGRIYKVAPTNNSPAAPDVPRILAAGMSDRSAEQLAGYLLHDELRVRQQAQWELGERAKATDDRGGAALAALQWATKPERPLTCRLHGIWGVMHVGQFSPQGTEALLPPLRDPDAEIRAQAARACGDVLLADAFPQLVKLLADEQPRVNYFAAISISKFRRTEALPAVLELLRRNNDRDPVVRHAAVLALLGSAGEAELAKLSTHESPAVRLGAVLALRRLASPLLAQFLNDGQPRVVNEAARAIYDVPVTAALPALAQLLERENVPLYVQRRAIHAHVRIGESNNAAALAAFVTTPKSEDLRAEILQSLAQWPAPPVLDPFLGAWRPLSPRDAAPAQQAVANCAEFVLKQGTDAERIALLNAVAKLQAVGAVKTVADYLANSRNTGRVRAVALETMAAFQAPSTADTAAEFLNDTSEHVRGAALQIVARLQPDRALKIIAAALERGATAERQAAFGLLGEMQATTAADLLLLWLLRYETGTVPPEIQLELLTAADGKSSRAVRQSLARIEKKRPADDPLAPYRMCLSGGDAARGEEIFFRNNETQCVRCHKIGAVGSDLGPNLTKIGGEKNREYLLDSIVVPDRTIAKGFESVKIATTDGKIYSGIIKHEDPQQLQLQLADGTLVTFAQTAIEERARSVSGMPLDMINSMTKRQVRDLIEYMSTLK